MLKNLYGEKRKPIAQAQLNAVLAAHERYAACAGGRRAQLTHIEMDGLDLANRNLSEAIFSGSSLVGATLYGTDLTMASLYCADLRGANLEAANLTRADMRGASLKGASLSYATLDGADMRAAMMMYVAPDAVSVVDLNSARGEGRDRDGVNTPNSVDFSNCSLKNASFGSAKLDGVNFSGAILEGAKFKSARLTNAVFTGAVLTGVNLKDLNVPAEALADCVTDVSAEAAAKAPKLRNALGAYQDWLQSGGKRGARAEFNGEDLRPLKGDLAGRVLAALQMQNALAIGADFSGCQLQAARFDGADLRDANFTDADLRGASFKGAKLAHARFDGANLGSLPMANGGQLKPDLSDAAAVIGQFERAVLEEPLTQLGLAAR